MAQKKSEKQTQAKNKVARPQLPSVEFPDRQQVFDDNVSQYETNPTEMERSQEEEREEQMRKDEGGR